MKTNSRDNCATFRAPSGCENEVVAVYNCVGGGGAQSANGGVSLSGRERLHRRLGRLPGARHRRSQGFHQNRKTTLRRHFAELCFKAEIDDTIREDGNQIATLSDCFAEQATR